MEIVQYMEKGNTMKTKIEKLYEDPKAKGFVNHLIRAYLPIYKIEKVWDWKKGQKHSCNVCNQKLASVGELFEAVHKPEFMEAFSEKMKKMVNNEKLTREDNPYIKAIGKDKVMGFTGKKTDTCMCHRCCEDLLNMVQTNLLMGDKNINYQVNQMKRDQAFSEFEESPKLNNEEKEKVKDIKKRVDKDRKVTTFGDLQALQDLKKKMENNNE